MKQGKRALILHAAGQRELFQRCDLNCPLFWGEKSLGPTQDVFSEAERRRSWGGVLSIINLVT